MRRYAIILVGLLGLWTGAIRAQEDVLVGVTWSRSELLSFDPRSGITKEKHLQLNPYEDFRGLAFDARRRRLYALAQGTQNLYYIDIDTMKTTHVGNLRIDKRVPGFADAGSLAHDPHTGTLYTAIEHWEGWDFTRIWSELCEVDPQTGGLKIVGRIDGPFIDSLVFSKADRQIYGLAIYGSGPWDSPFKADFVRIDPSTAYVQTLFPTPYHTMMGLALREPFTFFSWINWTSHFYGETDLRTGTVQALGDSDGVDVVSAMVYRDFPLGSRPLTKEPEPASFVYGGRVISVWDPDNVLGGRVRKGHRFSGELSYDIRAPYKYPDPNASPPYGMSAHVNGLDFSAPGLRATVVNNYYSGWDQSVSDGLQLEALAGEEATLSWTLTDSSARALPNNDALPDQFDLSEWERNSFVVTGYRSNNPWESPYYIVGTIDRITRTQTHLEFDTNGSQPSSFPRLFPAPRKTWFSAIQPNYPKGMRRRLGPPVRRHGD